MHSPNRPTITRHFCRQCQHCLDSETKAPLPQWLLRKFAATRWVATGTEEPEIFWCSCMKQTVVIKKLIRKKLIYTQFKTVINN